MNTTDIIEQLSDGDISDLLYVGERSYADAQRCARASELDDGGAKLLGLGLVERLGSVRLVSAPMSVDVLYELRRIGRAA